MGGAGTWHLGLHRPDRWCVLGPGAGFTTTHGYVGNLPEKLPDLPGSVPAHLRRRRLRRERLRRAGRRLLRRGRPADRGRPQHRGRASKPLGIPHDAPRGARAEAPVSRRSGRRRPRPSTPSTSAKGRPEYPKQVRFVTYTLKYPRATGSKSSAWTSTTSGPSSTPSAPTKRLHGQDRRTSASCACVCRRGATARADGRRHRRPEDSRRKPYLTAAASCHVYLEKRDGKWAAVLPERLVTDRLRHARRRPPACRGRSTTPSRRRSCACAAPAQPGTRRPQRVRRGRPGTLPGASGRSTSAATCRSRTTTT